MKLSVRDRGIKDDPWVSSPVNGGVFAWDAGRLGRSGMCRSVES